MRNVEPQKLDGETVNLITIEHWNGFLGFPAYPGIPLTSYEFINSGVDQKV